MSKSWWISCDWLSSGRWKLMLFPRGRQLVAGRLNDRMIEHCFSWYCSWHCIWFCSGCKRHSQLFNALTIIHFTWRLSWRVSRSCWRSIGYCCRNGRRSYCYTLSPQTTLVVRRFTLGRREVCSDVDGCADNFVRLVSQAFRPSLNVAGLIARR